MLSIVYVSILFFLVISLLYTYKTKIFINPLLLFYLPFTVEMGIYLLLYYDDYQISNITISVITFGMIGFFIGILLAKPIYYDTSTITYCNKRETLVAYQGTLHFLEVIAIVGYCIAIIEFIRDGLSGVFANNFLRNVRYSANYGNDDVFTFTQYFVLLFYVLSLILMYVDYNTIGKLSPKTKFYILLAMVSTMFTMARTIFISYALSYFCIYDCLKKNNISFKKIVKYVIICIVFIIISTQIAIVLSKQGSTSINSEDFWLYKYFGWNIIVFDQYFSPYPSVGHGIYSFGIFSRIFEFLPIYSTKVINSLPEIVGFNTYTYLGSPYRDFGIVGTFLFSVFVGYVSMISFKKALLNGGYYLIFYSVFCFACFTAFYANIFFQSYFLYVIIIILILKVIKIR